VERGLYTCTTSSRCRCRDIGDLWRIDLIGIASITVDYVNCDVLLVDMGVKLDVIELEHKSRRCRPRYGTIRNCVTGHGDICCEWSAECYYVPVVVSLGPHDRDTLNDRVIWSNYALAGTTERQCHGFDTRPTCNEEKKGKAWCADLCQTS